MILLIVRRNSENHPGVKVGSNVAAGARMVFSFLLSPPAAREKE
jgi:hypothetical protein